MLRSITSIVLVTLATSAMAAEPGYTYIQAGYQRVDIDDVAPGLNVDGDGIGIGGSYAFGDSFHAFGAYATTDLDFDVELDQITLGLGYHRRMSGNLDFVAEAAFIRAEAEFLGFSDDENGYGASIGLRGFLNEKFELAGSVDYVDVGSGSGDTSVEGAVRYYFIPSFALDVNAGIGDDVTTYGAGFQFYFGK